MKRILFICLGNICRSPMAETIFRKMVDDAELNREVGADSAGLISCHEGEPADPRMRAHAKRHGYNITSISRPVAEDDFYDFDLLVAMDDSNYDKLRQMAPGIDEEAKVVRMADYCRRLVIDHVPDPYYGGSQGFENVIEMLEDACGGLLDELKKQLSKN